MSPHLPLDRGVSNAVRLDARVVATDKNVPLIRIEVPIELEAEDLVPSVITSLPCVNLPVLDHVT